MGFRQGDPVVGRDPHGSRADQIMFRGIFERTGPTSVHHIKVPATYSVVSVSEVTQGYRELTLPLNQPIECLADSIGSFIAVPSSWLTSDRRTPRRTALEENNNQEVESSFEGSQRSLFDVVDCGLERFLQGNGPLVVDEHMETAFHLSTSCAIPSETNKCDLPSTSIGHTRASNSLISSCDTDDDLCSIPLYRNGQNLGDYIYLAVCALDARQAKRQKEFEKSFEEAFLKKRKKEEEEKSKPAFPRVLRLLLKSIVVASPYSTVHEASEKILTYLAKAKQKQIVEPRDFGLDSRWVWNANKKCERDINQALGLFERLEHKMESSSFLASTFSWTGECIADSLSKVKGSVNTRLRQTLSFFPFRQEDWQSASVYDLLSSRRFWAAYDDKVLNSLRSFIQAYDLSGESVECLQSTDLLLSFFIVLARNTNQDKNHGPADYMDCSKAPEVLNVLKEMQALVPRERNDIVQARRGKALSPPLPEISFVQCNSDLSTAERNAPVILDENNNGSNFQLSGCEKESDTYAKRWLRLKSIHFAIVESLARVVERLVSESRPTVAFSAELEEKYYIFQEFSPSKEFLKHAGEWTLLCSLVISCLEQSESQKVNALIPKTKDWILAQKAVLKKPTQLNGFAQEIAFRYAHTFSRISAKPLNMTAHAKKDLTKLGTSFFNSLGVIKNEEGEDAVRMANLFIAEKIQLRFPEMSFQDEFDDFFRRIDTRLNSLQGQEGHTSWKDSMWSFGSLLSKLVMSSQNYECSVGTVTSSYFNRDKQDVVLSACAYLFENMQEDIESPDLLSELLYAWCVMDGDIEKVIPNVDVLLCQEKFGFLPLRESIEERARLHGQLVYVLGMASALATIERKISDIPFENKSKPLATLLSDGFFVLSKKFLPMDHLQDLQLLCSRAFESDSRDSGIRSQEISIFSVLKQEPTSKSILEKFINETTSLLKKKFKVSFKRFDSREFMYFRRKEIGEETALHRDIDHFVRESPKLSRGQALFTVWVPLVALDQGMSSPVFLNGVYRQEIQGLALGSAIVFHATKYHEFTPQTSATPRLSLDFRVEAFE